MNKKKITPNPQHPVDRVTSGKLPNLLAELEEASLNNGTHTLPAGPPSFILCSYDGEDEQEQLYPTTTFFHSQISLEDSQGA